MHTEKKKWEKPSIVVLGKGQPEENVLGGCKGNEAGDPVNTWNNCNQLLEEQSSCPDCEALSFS